MEKINKLFLDALKASLSSTSVDWTSSCITIDGLTQIIRMSEVHHIVPMIFEAIYSSDAFGNLPINYSATIKRSVIQTVTMQTMRSSEFAMLSDHLRKSGMQPCVVKGIICRNLYPNPDERISGDEDVFIPEDQFASAHEAMLSFGMALINPDEDIHSIYEVPYAKQGSPLYIELHKHMFPPEYEAYGDLNRFFDGIHTRTEKIHKGECGLIENEIDGMKFLTMNHTDHLLYLILHSFKHFLHSGFGIRQVCDINLFANAYGSDIDWDYILTCLRDVRADLFALSIFKIGEKYLTFNPVKAFYPESWKSIEIDESPMLEDLLASGVFGQSDMSRKHSSNITLNAVIADRRGENAKTGRLHGMRMTDQCRDLFKRNAVPIVTETLESQNFAIIYHNHRPP